LNDETIKYKMRSLIKKNKKGNLTTEYSYLESVYKLAIF